MMTDSFDIDTAPARLDTMGLIHTFAPCTFRFEVH